jgi:hypothetical protein
LDVTAKIAIEKLDSEFIWDSIQAHDNQLLSQLKILFPHGFPIKFTVEEVQELSYEVRSM